jgi:hypothetical protein
MRSKLYWNKVTKGVKNQRQINYKCNISLETYENEEIYLQLCGGKTGINAVHKIITIPEFPQEGLLVVIDLSTITVGRF